MDKRLSWSLSCARTAGLVLAGGTLFIGSLACAGTLPGTGIEQSPHDFSGLGPTNGQICVVCHTPHNAISTEGPLWNHALSTTDHTGALYTSDTLNANPELPDGVSKLCLSCHDGSVAVDNFGGNNGNFYTITNQRAIGLDGLTNDHPFSFIYTGASDNDPGIAPPDTSVTVGSGGKSKSGTIADVMLDANGKVQCNSCHDVHNNYVVGDNLLKVTISSSQLCLACHTK